eukprot:1140566-Pelagomonas_calceolata.AAC.7
MQSVRRMLSNKLHLTRLPRVEGHICFSTGVPQHLRDDGANQFRRRSLQESGTEGEAKARTASPLPPEDLHCTLQHQRNSRVTPAEHASAHERERMCAGHACDAQVGEAKAEAARQGQQPFKKGVYFLGKVLWAKGYTELLDRLNEHERRTGEHVPVDVYGTGPDAKVRGCGCGVLVEAYLQINTPVPRH